MFMILVCVCNYEEDEKNQKILVGYGILAETSVIHNNPYSSTTAYEKEKAFFHACPISYPLHHIEVS